MHDSIYNKENNNNNNNDTTTNYNNRKENNDIDKDDDDDDDNDNEDDIDDNNNSIGDVERELCRKGIRTLMGTTMMNTNPHLVSAPMATYLIRNG